MPAYSAIHRVINRQTANKSSRRKNNANILARFLHDKRRNKQIDMEGNRTTRRGLKKFRNILIAVVIVGLGLFVGIRFYYPFGEGVKTGQLNFVVYKGIIFKTYEGRLIQTGFRSDATGGIQSNEFNFSITDKDIAEKLMTAGGQIVELRYKEYFGALPWRGYSKFIVDEIINMGPAPASSIESVPPVDPQ